MVRRIRQPLSNSNDVDDDVVDLAKIPVVDHHVRNGNVPPPLPILVEERHPHLPPGLDPRAALHTNEHDDDDEFVLPEECDDDDDDNDHCMLPNVPVDDNNNDKSQVPKQYDDDFVLPDHSEDEFVLPDQSSDDDDDDESVVPPAAVNNNVHDEFVLPDPSDNSDDDDDSAVPGQRHEYAVVPGLQGRTDHENRQNKGKGGMVPTATTTYRTLSNRESPSINKRQSTTATAAAQEVEPVFQGGEFQSSIENAAFGFSPPPPESRGHHTDAHSYDGNHVRTFQNSAHGNELSGRAKRTNDNLNIEMIECCSDEEYVPVWGHQTVTTKVRADHGSFTKRPKRAADPKQSLAQQHITVSNGRLVLRRDPPVDLGNGRKPESSDSSQKRNGSMDRDFKYQYPAPPEPNDPVTTHRGPFSSNHPVLPEVTNRSTVVHRPRRIRDPSARKVMVVPPKRTTTSATPFRLYAHPAALPPNNVPTAPITVSARTSTWERNDVFGGSGVGAGSYQIQRQPNTKTNPTEAEDASVVVVDSTQDDLDAPAKRKPASKPRSYKKGTKTNRASGSRGGGGKRGKWGWKNKGKRSTTKEKGNGRQRRVTNTWAGNTDDPQLRHVGGAEMSF